MKIFRKLRAVSLNGDDGTSFLTYAMAEVFLVVAGILIAVSINNWNEERKAQKELDSILITVKTDLENDLEQIETVLTYHTQLEPLLKKVIADSVEPATYFVDLRYMTLILGYPEFSIDKRGVNQLKNFTGNHDVAKDSLINRIIRFYESRELEYGVDDKFRQQDFTDNYFHWKQQDWWADYISFTDYTGFVRYAQTNDYRNRVSSFYFNNYLVVLPELRIFDTGANELIDQITKRIPE